MRDVESWAEVADVDRKATTLPLASFLNRSVAFLFDYLIMQAVTVLLLLEIIFSPGPQNIVVTVLNLLFVALGLLWVYSTLLEGFGGQSIGKRVLGLKVVQTNGRKLTYEHAAVRNFGKVLLPFELLFGYMLKDPRFLRYFDKFAGTTVIDLKNTHLYQTEEKEPPMRTKKNRRRRLNFYNLGACRQFHHCSISKGFCFFMLPVLLALAALRRRGATDFHGGTSKCQFFAMLLF